MCGIVGYVGPNGAVDFLIEGLRRLEYRGYDSAGVATVGDGELLVVKCAGRIDALAEKLGRYFLAGTTGIGHTRWATHGPATDANAHPHVGGNGLVAVVHNGVIENFRPHQRASPRRGLCVSLGDRHRSDCPSDRQLSGKANRHVAGRANG